MNDFNVFGDFGEVRMAPYYARNYSGILDEIEYCGWHKTNTPYHFERKNGTDNYLMIVTISGRGEAYVNDVEVRLDPDSIFLIPKNTRSGYRCVDGGDLWEFYWIRCVFWFGFDVAHSWMMSTENMLIALMEEPEFVRDIIDTYLKRTIALYDRIWDAGYHFDEMFWYDDMGYKNTTFFSPATYRKLIMPFHKTAVDWAHDHGIYVELHSCGDIMTLLPDITSTGLDVPNPLEVKAEMDILQVKKAYGDNLVLHGGFNAMLWNNTDAIVAEIKDKLPIPKENGGYIFSSDHSIPNSVSLETMRQIAEAYKKVGKY